MKHKTIRIALASCLLITSLLFGGTVFAQDGDLPDAGITPDSPFYFLDKMGKSIGMFFTFGNEAKTKKALRYAEERLAEVRDMAAKNRVREMVRAANDYKGYMAMVTERLENAGVTDNLTERVALAAARHLAILENMNNQGQKQARATIRQAKEASINGEINALRAMARNRLEKAIGTAAGSIEGCMERARVRIMANIASDNATADMEEALDFAARIATLEDEIIAIAEEKGIDVTAIQERLAHSIANRLETLSRIYENAPESARKGIENAIENSVRKYERAVEKLRERNSLGDIPDEATVMNRIQAEVRARLGINAPYNAPAGITVQVRTETANQEQTREQKETGDQGNNRQHGN